MSRSYEMYVEVKGFDKKRRSDIEDACNQEWTFDDFEFFDSKLSGKYELFACGKSNLAGGEGEEEFSQRLSRAIFKANKGPCDIMVSATCLEDLPHEDFTFGAEEYDEIKEELQAEDEE